MKLVENWKQGWKWFSTQAMALSVTIQAVWVALPADMKSSVPGEWVAYLTIALLVFGTVGRFVKQS